MIRPGRVLLLSLLVTGAAQAGAEVRIVNGNGTDEGLNDPTSAAPVGTTPGRPSAPSGGSSSSTPRRSGQRPWGTRCRSGSTPSSQPRLQRGHRGPGLVRPHRALRQLARALGPGQRAGGAGLDPSQDEIQARFSSSVGKPGCAVGGWYYGLDNLAPTGMTDLASVVLHELAPGMGFIKSAGVFREQVLDERPPSDCSPSSATPPTRPPSGPR